jgi:hypothetical protein
LGSSKGVLHANFESSFFACWMWEKWQCLLKGFMMHAAECLALHVAIEKPPGLNIKWI